MRRALIQASQAMEGLPSNRGLTNPPAQAQEMKEGALRVL